MTAESDKSIPREWFFRFRAEEVPQRRAVSGPLPDHLVPLMNLYLRYRPHLIEGKDPGTLFLNRNGGALTPATLQGLVGDITERHIGQRIPPVAFRDIFAYFWLTRPTKPNEDPYVTLASIRWASYHGVRFRFDPKYRAGVLAKIGANKRAA